MSFTTAALILAWLAIIVLAFGFAATAATGPYSAGGPCGCRPGARAGLPESARATPRPLTASRRYVFTAEPGVQHLRRGPAGVPEAGRDVRAGVAEFAVLAAVR